MYSFLNCALMHRTLNRGVWSTLEKKEREISNSAVLKVKILLSFGKNNIVAGGASIPDFFTKILEYKKFDENDEEIYIREVYTFPNDASVKGKDIEDYKVKLLTI
jgi:DNA/RNA endonuclease G (NUC1)